MRGEFQEMSYQRKTGHRGTGKKREGEEHVSPEKLPSGLYLISTPIGNLGDMTTRARAALGQLDLLLCEDTRVTRKLLTAYAISPMPALESYHEHNAAKMEGRILSVLGEGKAVGLVSDSGTPIISDPGARIVPAAVESGHKVTALPGASAVIMALCLSGLPSERFFFAGFLPQKPSTRKKDLATLAAIPSTLIFYESPHRLKASLSDMVATLGGHRPAAVCRELTKMHEEVRRGTLDELASFYKNNEEVIKGEIVILVGALAGSPPPDHGVSNRDAASESASQHEIDALLEHALSQQTVRDAVAAVVKQTGLPKREIYARALGLQQKENRDDQEK